MGRRIEAYTTVKDMSIGAIDAIESNFKAPKAKKSQKRASLLEMDDFDPLGFDSFPKKSKSKDKSKDKAGKLGKAAKKSESPGAEEFRSKLSVLTGDASIQDDGIISGSQSLSRSHCSELGISQCAAGRHPRGERSVLLRGASADRRTRADRLGFAESRLLRGGAERRGGQRGQLGIRCETGVSLRSRCGARSEVVR